MVVNDVKDIVVSTLGIEDRADTIDASTRLFGEMPELDSLSVLELVGVIENRFGFSVEDHEITEDVFATVGSLTAYVESKVATVPGG